MDFPHDHMHLSQVLQSNFKKLLRKEKRYS